MKLGCTSTRAGRPPAECLACRAPPIVDVGLAQLALADEAWTCPRVLEEALSVGQDPDCRGQVRHSAPSASTPWEPVGRLRLAGGSTRDAMQGMRGFGDGAKLTRLSV